MILYTVIPCYNEESVIAQTHLRMHELYASMIEEKLIDSKSRIVFVNDGSSDKTWSLIKALCEKDCYVRGINLSRNRGHQNALLAGLMQVKSEADAVISMDADLQDDIHAIKSMVEKYKQGADIVYGVRSARTTDTFFKRFTAESFYRLMDMLGANTIFNHADYRLMSRRALDGLAEFKEVHLFLRGIVPMIGYPSDYVYFERNERFAGESKYPLKKMISFAIDGITSLSIKPIRIISGFGMMAIIFSFVMLVYTMISYLQGNANPGWSSIMVSIWFIGGSILLSLGIVGEYVGKTYIETKARPRFIIEEYTDNHDETHS